MTASPGLIVISGPSGSGKGSLICDLLAERPDLRCAVSATTRLPRPGEREGVDYRFMSEDEFSARERAGEFVETVSYAGNRYGTLAEELTDAGGAGVVVEIETRGAAALRARMPHARLIFIAPPSLAELETRLRARGSEDELAIARRLSAAREELTRTRLYDLVIVNRDRSLAAAELARAVAADRLAGVSAAEN